MTITHPWATLREVRQLLQDIKLQSTLSQPLLERVDLVLQDIKPEKNDYQYEEDEG